MRVVFIPKSGGGQSGPSGQSGGPQANAAPSPHYEGSPMQLVPPAHSPHAPYSPGHGQHMPQPAPQPAPHAAAMYSPQAGGYAPHSGGGGMAYGMAAAWPAAPGMDGSPQSREMGFMAPVRDGYEPESRRRSRSTGRFVRGMEMRGQSEPDEEDEEDGGLASSRPKPSGGLKKRVKKLEQKLEKLCEMLEEALEEKGEKAKSKGKGRKKSEPEEDEDDEDDPAPSPVAGPLAEVQQKLEAALQGKPALQHIPAIMASLLAVLESPPATWPPYLAKQDYSGIFGMECKELLAKAQQFKAGQVDAAAVKKELEHSGAALLQLFAQLMHTETSK